MTHVHNWSPEIVARTNRILERAEAQKPNWIRTIDAYLYWVLLLLAILCNFILSVVIVPFLLVLKGIWLYGSLAFISASFGLMVSLILHSLDQLKTAQHIIASVFIPAIALINVAIFALLSNKLIAILKLQTPPHNPIIVAVVYVLGYVLPECVMHLRK